MGELDITSLYTIKDDPEKQCELIKGMHDLGVVGIIVYYVGVFVPRLDDSFLQTANEINFAIIQMPVNDTNIRFNEAVTEISQMLLNTETLNLSRLSCGNFQKFRNGRKRLKRHLKCWLMP